MSEFSRELSWLEVSVAAALLLINVVLSRRLGLKLERQILISGFRMMIQLTLLGLVLKQIFALASAIPVLVLATAMTVIAGYSAITRINKRHPGIHFDAIVSVWASSWIVTSIAVLVIVKPVSWHDPQIVIPLLGMVLGNSLTGISLGIDRFLSETVNRKEEIELRLTLGATRWQATQDCFADAAKAAMVPILNTMSVAGIVSLPGMMTGQLLAGAPPIQAVQYQIMIMFVIAAAIAMGVFASLSLTYRRITTSDHQLSLSQVLPKV